jgi:hypothetical protein
MQSLRCNGRRQKWQRQQQSGKDFKDGKLHRDDGPAIERKDGYKAWYADGRRHRESGPAIEDPNGYKAWYREAQFHRRDGPAVIHPRAVVELM